jgi:hypothetical protein
VKIYGKGERIIKMKKLIVLLVLFSILLTGCTKLLNTESEAVEAEVVHIYHRSIMILPQKAGNATILTTYPARYEVTVQYNDITTTISSQELYERVRVGDKVSCNLITKYYDDNSIEQELEWIA